MTDIFVLNPVTITHFLSVVSSLTNCHHKKQSLYKIALSNDERIKNVSVEIRTNIKGGEDENQQHEDFGKVNIKFVLKVA